MFNLMMDRQPTSPGDFYKLKWELFSQSGNYSAKSNIIQPNIIQPNNIQPNGILFSQMYRRQHLAE
jgi:hypothetical protein